MPKQLPFLPGNSYADPTITRYHKTQLFGVKDQIQTGKCISLICNSFCRENRKP